MKEKLIAAAKRALWTAIEAALAMIPVGARIQEVDWLDILSVVALAALISFLKSIAISMPEVANDAGMLLIDTSDPEVDRYLLQYNTDLETLKTMKTVKFKVNPNAKLMAEDVQDD